MRTTTTNTTIETQIHDMAGNLYNVEADAHCVFTPTVPGVDARWDGPSVTLDDFRVENIRITRNGNTIVIHSPADMPDQFKEEEADWIEAEAVRGLQAALEEPSEPMEGI